MAKFKVNDRVRIIATGEIGTVKARDIVPIEGSKRIKIEYIVKIGDGFDNWKSFSKKEIQSVAEEKKEPRVYTKVYDAANGFKITMYGKVDIQEWLGRERVLRIGYAIYNPHDKYDETHGIRIARKRSRTSPFCKMSSSFNGEFNAPTVEAIMDVKADYIKNNFDNFINKAKRRETNNS